MSHLHLAYSTSTRDQLSRWPWSEKPTKMLVAFPYLRNYDSMSPAARPARLMLDSGAFTVWKTGGTIDMSTLIEAGRHDRWNVVVALDVIGDAEASVRNAEVMSLELGVEKVMPVFHFGEPWSALEAYKERGYHMIGLSCRFGEPVTESYAWTQQCFARAWPHRFHSFGWVQERYLHTFPFWSADTSSWATAPQCYGAWKWARRGRWAGQAKRRLRVRGSVPLRPEIDFYNQLGRELGRKWRAEFQSHGFEETL